MQRRDSECGDGQWQFYSKRCYPKQQHNPRFEIGASVSEENCKAAQLHHCNKDSEMNIITNDQNKEETKL